MKTGFIEGESPNELKEAELESYYLADVECKEKVCINFEDSEELVKNLMRIPESVTETIWMEINKGRILRVKHA